jgi:hypothetical protein
MKPARRKGKVMAKYSPPDQSKIGQLIDVIVLMGLSIGALYLPLKMGMSGADKVVTTPVIDPTWETLGQTVAQAAQYEALGYTPETAHDLILARFDYSFSWSSLILMAVIIIGYFFMMLKLSQQEYKDVINEKFGE